MRAFFCGVLTCLVVSGPAAAWTAPDGPAAFTALVETPLRVTGDAAGGAGLLAAPAVALIGDALSLADATWVPAGPLDGWVSGPVHRLALAISWSGTSVLEALRNEDIDRLPEDPATYRTAAPGVGRLDTFLSGIGAIRLAARDLLTGPALALLHLAGAREQADRLTRASHEARTRLLGPLALPIPSAAPPPAPPERSAKPAPEPGGPSGDRPTPGIRP